MLAHFDTAVPKKDVLLQGFVGRVAAVLIRHDPGHTGFGGGVDKLVLYFGWGGHRHGDDEDVLALQRFDQGGFVVVVDFLDRGAFGHAGFGVGARDGRYFVLAGCNEGFGHILADLAACLVGVLLLERCFHQGGTVLGSSGETYPYDGDVFDMVFEALWLVFGVLLCHDGDVSRLNCSVVVEVCRSIFKATT